MWPAAPPPRSICSPADALFVSALQCSDQLGAGQIQQAIAAPLRAFGSAGCARRGGRGDVRPAAVPGLPTAA